MILNGLREREIREKLDNYPYEDDNWFVRSSASTYDKQEAVIWHKSCKGYTRRSHYPVHPLKFICVNCYTRIPPGLEFAILTDLLILHEDKETLSWIETYGQ